MALKQDLMAGSMPAALANKVGLDPIASVAGAGSGQSTATQLASNCANISSGSGGVALSSNEQMSFIVNTSGGTITVYPKAGTTTTNFNGGSANAGISVPNGKSVLVIPAGTTLMAVISA